MKKLKAFILSSALLSACTSFGITQTQADRVDSQLITEGTIYLQDPDSPQAYDQRFVIDGIFLDFERYENNIWTNIARLGGSLTVPGSVRLIKDPGAAVLAIDGDDINNLIRETPLDNTVLVGDIVGDLFLGGHSNIIFATSLHDESYVVEQADDSLNSTGTQFFVDYTITENNAVATDSIKLRGVSLPSSVTAQIKMYYTNDFVNPIYVNVTDDEFSNGDGEPLDEATGIIALRPNTYAFAGKSIRMELNVSESIVLSGGTTDGTDIYMEGENTSVKLGINWSGSILSIDGGINIADGDLYVTKNIYGVTWDSQTTPADNNWQGVASGNGVIVAVASSGTGNRVMTSPDGEVWTIQTSPADNDWEAITFSEDEELFVAVASSGTGNRVMTSADGIAWTLRTSSADNDWTSITSGDGLLVAVAESGTDRVMTSTDAITWTSRTSADETATWRGVAYGNGVFVAVADGGTSQIMTSTDGITWTQRTPSELNNWNGVEFGEGIFVAVSWTGLNDRVMTSPDGITWTSRVTPISDNFRGIAYGNGTFISPSYSDSTVMASQDGINWTDYTMPVSGMRGIVYSEYLNTFISVGESGTGNRAATSAEESYDILTIASATSTLNMHYNNIVNLGDPTNGQDAATKNYVDGHGTNGVWTRTGTTIASTTPGDDLNITGILDVGSHYVRSVSEPTLSDDAATKNYVDTHDNNGIWARTGTTIATANAGDDLDMGTGTVTSSDFIGPLSGQADTVATITGLAPDTATTQATQPNITSVGTLTSLGVTGTATAGTLTDGTTSIASGNYTGAGNITGTDVDISAGTGAYSSSGTIDGGDISAVNLTSPASIYIKDSLTRMKFGFTKGSVGSAALEDNVGYSQYLVGTSGDINIASRSSLASDIVLYTCKTTAAIEGLRIDENQDVTIPNGDLTLTSGTVSATTFTGDLNGTINTATTGATQSAGDNSTKIATTAYADAAVSGTALWDRTLGIISPVTVGDAVATTGNLQGSNITATADIAGVNGDFSGDLTASNYTGTGSADIAGEFTVGAKTLYANTSAKVGVGTLDPKINLHVLTGGTSGLGTIPLNRGMAITASEQGSSRFYWENTSNTSGKRVGVNTYSTDGWQWSFMNDTAGASSSIGSSFSISASTGLVNAFHDFQVEGAAIFETDVTVSNNLEVVGTLTGVGANYSGDVNVDGNLTVLGTQTVVSVANMLVEDKYCKYGFGYNSQTATEGGCTLVLSVDATSDTVATGGFTAGVASTSNPTVITTGSGTFTAGDLLMFIDANTENNNDLFEVMSHVGTTLTIRGIGTETTVEGFSGNQFTTDATVAGTIYKPTVAIAQFGTDGKREYGLGSASGIVYTDGLTIGGADTQLQFNSSGSLAGSSSLTWDGSTLDVAGDISANTATFTNNVHINSSGTLYVQGESSGNGDAISIAADRIGVVNGYCIGHEGTSLYNRSAGDFRWYVNSLADSGVSSKMTLSGSALNVAVNTAIAGDLTVNTGDLTVGANATITGITTNTGAVVMGSTLDVAGDVTVEESNLFIDAATSTTKGLYFRNASDVVKGTLDFVNDGVDGTIKLMSTGDLDVTAPTELTINATQVVLDATTGDLSMTGDLALSAGNLTLAGSKKISWNNGSEVFKILQTGSAMTFEGTAIAGFYNTAGKTFGVGTSGGYTNRVMEIFNDDEIADIYVGNVDPIAAGLSFVNWGGLYIRANSNPTNTGLYFGGGSGSSVIKQAFLLNTNGTATFASNVTAAEDLTVDTDTLFVDASANRVGVNTVSPLYGLDVRGDGYYSGEVTIDGDNLYLNSATQASGYFNSTRITAGTLSEFEFDNNGSFRASMEADLTDYANGYTGLKFTTKGSDGNVQRLLLNETGATVAGSIAVPFVAKSDFRCEQDFESTGTQVFTAAGFTAITNFSDNVVHANYTTSHSNVTVTAAGLYTASMDNLSFQTSGTGAAEVECLLYVDDAAYATASGANAGWKRTVSNQASDGTVVASKSINLTAGQTVSWRIKTAATETLLWDYGTVRLDRE